MKTTIIISTSIIIVTMILILISRSTAQTEQHKYEVIKEFESFEVRKYESAIFSSVKINKKDYKSMSSEGFRILAGYIFGNNESNEKIAMTSPVAMEFGDSSKMMFMVPKAYSLDNLPEPKNNKIVFEKKDEKVMAAIRFGGWADDEKIEKYKALLIEAVEKEGFSHNNQFLFLGYNPPYDVVNRRNEVVVELINFQ